MRTLAFVIALSLASACFAETWIVKYEVLEHAPLYFSVMDSTSATNMCAVSHPPGTECDYGKSQVSKFALFGSKQAAVDFLNGDSHKAIANTAKLFRAELFEMIEVVITEPEPPPPPKTKDVRHYVLIEKDTTYGMEFDWKPASPKKKAAPKKRSWKMDPPLPRASPKVTRKLMAPVRCLDIDHGVTYRLGTAPDCETAHARLLCANDPPMEWIDITGEVDALAPRVTRKSRAPLLLGPWTHVRIN